MAEIHIADIGTVMRIRVVSDSSGSSTSYVDISSATALTIKMKPPTNPTKSSTASLTSGGVDGLMEITSVSTSFTEDGNWRIQGLVTIPTGTFNTETGSFEVYKNL